jgi:hypothetical protein
MTNLVIPVLFSLVVVLLILLLVFVIGFGLFLCFLLCLSFFILLFYLLDFFFHGFFLLLCSLSLGIDDSGGESSIAEVRWADVEKVLAEPLEQEIPKSRASILQKPTLVRYAPYCLVL